jgi:hypothetical protein
MENIGFVDNRIKIRKTKHLTLGNGKYHRRVCGLKIVNGFTHDRLNQIGI